MRNKGKSQYRFKDNPLEEVFAKEWEAENLAGKNGYLDYMLAEHDNRPSGEVMERDREVAATVIQWLGSPVGSHFVKRVLGIFKEKDREKFLKISDELVNSILNLTVATPRRMAEAVERVERTVTEYRNALLKYFK